MTSLYNNYLRYFENRIKVVPVLKSGIVVKTSRVANTASYWVKPLKQSEFLNVAGLALVTDDIYSNYEALWFENDTMLDAFLKIAEWRLPLILNHIVVQKHKTKSDCFVFFRSSNPSKTTVRMARRYTDPDTEDNYSYLVKDKKYVPCETDIIKHYGGGDKVIAAPSGGYELIHNDFDTVKSQLSDNDKSELLRLSISFDKTYPVVRTCIYKSNDMAKVEAVYNDFNKSFRVVSYLTSIGYEEQFSYDGCTYLKAPKSKNKWDVKWDGRFLSSFSKETGLLFRSRYAPSQVYTHFEFNKNSRTAYTTMVKMGFGKDENVLIRKDDYIEHKLWDHRYFEKYPGYPSMVGWKVCVGITEEFAFYATSNAMKTTLKLDRVIAVRRNVTTTGNRRQEINNDFFIKK